MTRLILLLTLITVIWGCTQEKKAEDVILSGTITGIEDSKPKIRIVERIYLDREGYDKSIALDANGHFEDTLKIPKSGYYSVFVGDKYMTLYMNKGDHLQLKGDMDPSGFYESLSFTGKGKKVNNYLARKAVLREKQSVSAPDKLFMLQEDEFRKTVQNLKGALDSLAEASNVEEDFKKREIKGNHYEYALSILKYPSFHKHFAKKDSLELSEDFYAGIKDIDYFDEEALAEIPQYKAVVFAKFNKTIEDIYNKKAGNEVDDWRSSSMEALDTYPKGKIKDVLLERNIYYLSPGQEDVKETYEYFMAELQSGFIKEKVRKKYQTIEKLLKGNPSPGFKYENHKGGNTSLNDLKGKYVYIDVWATWCGPCKAEIPHLKEVEEDYHDKNIEFVSISIDEQKHRDKWKKMVEDEALGGIQLIADDAWKSGFVTDYAIDGIPRFILIDPEGNIVSADAPRPSSAKLRELFDSLDI